MDIQTAEREVRAKRDGCTCEPACIVRCCHWDGFVITLVDGQAWADFCPTADGEIPSGHHRWVVSRFREAATLVCAAFPRCIGCGNRFSEEKAEYATETEALAFFFVEEARLIARDPQDDERS